MSNGNLHITGSGRVHGGTYARVKISGSGCVTGDVQAEEITVSGTGRFSGHVAASYLTVSGSGRIDGGLTGDVFHTSGSCRIEGSVVVRHLTVDGSCRIGGGVQAEQLTSRGAINILDDVKVEQFQSHGGLQIGGKLYAKRVQIELTGESKVSGIVCEEVECVSGKSHPINRVLSLVLSSFTAKNQKTMQLVAQSIQADVVRIEQATVDVIHGSSVYIGPKCWVRRVEYRDCITIDPTATVGEQVRIG